MPKISVIVPCYNHAHYLVECIDSILAQTSKDWECIIVNDGSTDNTAEIAREQADRDDRITVLNKDNAGLSEARNSGIKQARGIYILPLDADDKIAPDYISKALSIFDDTPETDLVYCNADFFGDVNEPWYIKEFSLYNLAISNVIFCSAVYRKSAWQKVNGYDKNLHRGLEDWEFWISILKNNGRVHKLEETLFFYRKKNESMVSLMDPAYIDYARDYTVRKHYTFFIEQFGSIHQLIAEKKGLHTELKSRKLVSHLFFHTILRRKPTKLLTNFFETYFKGI